jgi:MerR family transcriptional regulator, mercuric resistance operon regulatory protein
MDHRGERRHTIGGLAKQCGVGIETVRFYQRRGLLLTPKRSKAVEAGGSIRRYGEEDIERLRFIRSAQTAGFTLREIKELLILDASHDRPRVRKLADERVAALDAKIAELQTARRNLRRLSRRCSSTQVGPCPILQTFRSEHAPT